MPGRAARVADRREEWMMIAIRLIEADCRPNSANARTNQWVHAPATTAGAHVFVSGAHSIDREDCKFCTAPAAGARGGMMWTAAASYT
jgi:hypothetical protein